MIGKLDPVLPPELRDRAERLLNKGGRQLLGLVGTPGAGKSTLAALLAATLGSYAKVVPMDGFHLANAELARLGRAARKGAPDTFDVFGYRALLHRLRHADPDEIVYAPAFHREIEEAVAGEIGVEPDIRLVISEGNYLLLDKGPWSPVAALFDECWYVDVPIDEQKRRLVERHMRYGRSREAAEAWVENTDAPNARLVEASRTRADLILPWV